MTGPAPETDPGALPRGDDVRVSVGRLAATYAEVDIAPVDPLLLREMGITDRGVVQLTARRGQTMVTRVRALAEDSGEGLIRLAGHQLKTLRAGIGDALTMQRIELGPARRLILEPLAPLGRPITEYERELLPELATQQQVVRTGMLLAVQLSDFRRKVLFRVLAVTPGVGIVTQETRLVLRTSMLPPGVAANLITFDDVGGLQAEVEQIRELVQTPLKHPRVFDQLGIEPPRGILLHGPPGVGKTYLARAIANEVGAHFLYINGPEILSSVQGGTEANLRSIFEEAMESSPSVVMIDEIDAIAPQRRDSGHSDARMGTQLLSLLDGLVSMEDVVVLGTTNRIDAIDPALRRPGRFDREILIGPPDAPGRLSILEIHTRSVPLSSDAGAYLPEIARSTHGYTGADLVDLVREAGLHALRRHLGAGFESLQGEDGTIPDVSVEEDDLRYALEHTRPSALREALITAPTMRWRDIGGLESAIQTLRETVELPLANAAAFTDIGLRPPRGVLLHGPSGTGKTLLASAVAHESGANLVAVSGPEIFSKWLGESEGHIRDAFAMARQSAPTVVVLDQLDAMAPPRTGSNLNPASERVVNQLLAELDELATAPHVVVVGVTNRPDLVDPALLRSGRLGVQIAIPRPDKRARAEILRIHLRAELRPAEGDPAWQQAIEEVAVESEGLVGAELAALCVQARMLALRQSKFARHIRLEPGHLLHAVHDSQINTVADAGGEEPDNLQRATE